MVRIDVSPIIINGRQKATNSGTFYSAKLGDEIILESTTEPFYNAARVLQSRGLSGQFGMWVAGKERLTGDIDRCAGITVREDSKQFALIKYREFEEISNEAAT